VKKRKAAGKKPIYNSKKKQGSDNKKPWDGTSIQALRQHLGLTQRELSERLGTRQQTISEWETGMYRPRGASATLLTFVAEQAKFKYRAAPPDKKP
jgi:DNA-binding transcriptional regulator YiaG